MDKQIREHYRDTILQEAMHRYGIAHHQIRPLGGFESFIYEFECGSQAYILRLGHSLRRSAALIQGEVDWITYLAMGGVSVATAIRSTNGKLVETVDDGQGGQFLVTAFVKARGRPAWEVGWTPTLYERYGHLLGSIHALTTQYQPAEVAWRRPDGLEEGLAIVERALPASEAVAAQKYQALCAYLRTLPQDSASYGLIHYDAHAANLYIDGTGTITLFDFDDCAYSWLINDLAIVLFYMVPGVEDVPTFTQEFLRHFLRGYRHAHRLDPQWLKEMPHFLKLREIELYAVIHRSYDARHIADEPYMRDRKSKIEQDVPYIDFDFESLSAYYGADA